MLGCLAAVLLVCLAAPRGRLLPQQANGVVQAYVGSVTNFRGDLRKGGGCDNFFESNCEVYVRLKAGTTSGTNNLVREPDLFQPWS